MSPEALDPLVLEREGISDQDLSDLAGNGVVGHVLAATQIGC